MKTVALKRPDGKARLSVPAPRTKRCEHCKADFLVMRPLQLVCSGLCGALVAIAKRQKAERKADKEKLQAMKPLSYWNEKAQAAFNKFVRLRDLKAGHGCIDCGKPFEPERPGGAVDAGHFLSRGSAKHLRFDERNCFAQRKNCNRPGGTTREAFRAGVIARIGLEAVEALEADHAPRQYRAGDLEEIIATYKAKAKELSK